MIYLIIGLGLAVILGLIGLRMMLRAQYIAAIPFKKTSEIASNPQAGDDKFRISTEGKVIPHPQPLIAPCSGKPCLYFEIKVERHYKKSERTENGVKETSHTDTAQTAKQGSQFQVDDGSGPVVVDATQEVDAKLTQSFRQHQSAWGDIQFGQFRTHVAHTAGITGSTCTEKLLPIEQPTLYVMGKLAGGMITKPDGMLGKVMLSPRGRAGLIGATTNAMIGSWVGAGVALIAGILMMIFVPVPKVDSNECKNPMQGEVNCIGFFKSNDGIEMPWKVKEDGMYSVVIEATGTDEQLRLWPEVIVLHENEVLAKEDTTDHKSVTLSGPAKAGDYAIHVQDVSKSHVQTLTSGVHFRVTIKKTGPLPAPSASASASSSHSHKVDKGDVCPKDLSIAKLPLACATKLDAKGVTFTWKVDKKANYLIVALPEDEAAPFTPKFTLIDAKGAKKDSKVDDDDKTTSALELEDLAPGVYKIVVNDSDPKHATKPESFGIMIESE